MPNSSLDRSGALHRLRHDDFDVVVIGGGITGAGVALDAASRGLRTALVERDDFASGTSSKSSKLVHGGLRYLDQREFRLVHEGLAERQRVIENAPHLVSILPFLVPVLRRGGAIDRRLAPFLGGALWMYDLVGGVRIGTRHRRITADEALAHMPTLDRARVSSGYVYFDAQADDARLTLAIIRTAASHGAAVANRARVVGFEKRNDAVVGVRVVASESNTDDEITVRARVVVNATGVWADHVRAFDEGGHPSSITPAKGVHITVPWSRVRNDVAAIVPTADDRRSVFVIPWGEHTYVGTTDTSFDGSIDEPRCTRDDITYLLRALNEVTTVHATEDDVIGTWAGLRPLLRAPGRPRTTDLSRRHSVRTSTSGVVTVTGGKLTTYRRMAADAVDAAAHRLPGRVGPSCTKRLRLAGSEGIDPPRAVLPTPGSSPSTRSVDEHLRGRYGADAAAVKSLARSIPDGGEPLVPGLPYLRAEAVYAVREEMALTLDDVLARRTRARILDHSATVAAAPAVGALLASELGWDSSTTDQEVARFVALANTDRW
ncbi:MAG: glycerol-3-phosphate dehydrogenase/oxidase [Acidimicrobiia bacterium]